MELREKLDRVLVEYASVNEHELGEDKFGGHHDKTKTTDAILDVLISVLPEMRLDKYGYSHNEEDLAYNTAIQKIENILTGAKEQTK